MDANEFMHLPVRVGAGDHAQNRIQQHRRQIEPFAFRSPVVLQEFERFFGCPVEYGSASDQWWFSNETLTVPLITGDPYLLETLQPFCDEAARERNTAVGTLRSSVGNELQKLLPHGKARDE